MFHCELKWNFPILHTMKQIKLSFLFNPLRKFPKLRLDILKNCNKSGLKYYPLVDSTI